MHQSNNLEKFESTRIIKHMESARYWNNSKCKTKKGKVFAPKSYTWDRDLFKKL